MNLHAKYLQNKVRIIFFLRLAQDGSRPNLQDEMDYKNDSSYGWFKDVEGFDLQPLGLGTLKKKEQLLGGEKKIEGKVLRPQRRVAGGNISQKKEERNFVRFKNVNF